MPKLNRMDRVTDIALARVTGAVGQVRKQFEGTNPYRKEPVPPRQQLYEYMQKTPQDIEGMRSIDPLTADRYVADMEKLRLRYQEDK